MAFVPGQPVTAVVVSGDGTGQGRTKRELQSGMGMAGPWCSYRDSPSPLFGGYRGRGCWRGWRGRCRWCPGAPCALSAGGGGAPGQRKERAKGEGQGRGQRCRCRPAEPCGLAEVRGQPRAEGAAARSAAPPAPGAAPAAAPRRGGCQILRDTGGRTEGKLRPTKGPSPGRGCSGDA